MKQRIWGKPSMRRIVAALLIVAMMTGGLPMVAVFGRGVSYGASLSPTEVLDIAETIEDAKAKAEIIAAVKEGAQVRFRYTTDGRISGYQIIREGVSKAHEDMTTQEKRAALDLLIQRGTVPNRISVGGAYYSLNITLWMEQGIIVYGETKKVNDDNAVTAGSNYKNGQYRFWGYDVNGGLYGNDDFPRDSDTGTPAYEKNWLTTGEIRESSIARRYIGEHGISANNRYSESDKKTTAKLWLDHNPAWKRAGITVNYILEHFYFNSVITDSGLTTGQFTGVHRSKQSGTLYYQSFSVKGKTVLFEISEGTVEERILIPEEGLPEEPVEPEEPEDIALEMEVALTLPAVTYTGHPVTATDSTVFYADGERRSAARVYAEGLASNRFHLPSGGGTIKKSGSVPTKATAVFQNAGTYPVSLTVTKKGGGSGSDTKTIDVQQTPSILHSLTGTQKQNRAQVLNLWVATHPDRPLKTMWIELKDLTTDETVRLDHRLGESENTLKNGDIIKTRPIEALESDSLFTNCRLEFLTKNGEERKFSYTVYVKDSGGNTDRVEETFTVLPDRPPVAEIGMEETFLRRKGENRSEITAADHSQTDGDQLERTWSFVPLTDQGTEKGAFSNVTALAGYEDLSFGTKQKISFFKDGVGRFRVRLKVRDLWTEPTLEEYITEADRLSAVVVKDGDVINIAPQVSMEAVDMKKAELLFVCEDRETGEMAESQLAQVSAALLEKGYDGKITVQSILPQVTSDQQPWEKTIEVDTPFGYRGSWTPLYERQNFIADDQRLYKIDATWLGADLSYYPQAPYTITAWNGETGAVEWTYTFDEQVLQVPDSGPYFSQDDTDTYLYFVSQGKTLVLDKKTGAKLAVLSFAVGNRCFAEGNYIFTVKSDGIYRIHTGSGAVTRIYSGRMGEGAERFGAKLQGVIRSGQTLYRFAMDLRTQQVKLYKLGVAASSEKTYDAEAFCTDGSLLVRETMGDTITFLLFDEKGGLISSVAHSGRELMGTTVRDGSGNAAYAAFIDSEKQSSSYCITVTCYEIRTGKKAEVILKDRRGYPTEPEIIAAEQVGDTVYVATGGYITWIAGDGWANGPSHGYPQRTKTVRFRMNGEPTGEEVENSALQLDDMKEYGIRSDGYAVIQSAQNGQYQTPPSGNITTMYRRYRTKEQAEQRYRSKYLTRDGSYHRQGAFLLTKEQVTATPLEEWVKRWLGDDEETSTYVNIKETSGGGRLHRPVELQADTTYYYEYDLFTPDGNIEDAEDIFSVRSRVEGNTGSSRKGQYTVTEAMTETFADSKITNSYFYGASPESIVSDRLEASPVPERLKVRSDSAEIRFQVKEGCRAVLSFAYLLERYGEDAYFGNRITIDGEEWKMPLTKGRTLSGRYTHPYLLEEGEHTIALHCSTYSTSESVTAIDDMRVDYVSYSENTAAAGERELVDGDVSRKEEIGQGWAKISGSFHTPKAVGAYQKIEGTIATETAGDGTASLLESVTHRSKSLTLQAPAGETPIYAEVEAKSKPVKSSGRYYSVGWNAGGTGVTSYPETFFSANDENRLGSRGLPQEFTFILRGKGTEDSAWGDPAVKMTFGGTSSMNGGGTMGSVFLASVAETGNAVKEQEFFLCPQGQSAGIYGADLKFQTAAQMAFVPGGTGPRGVTNLRVYTVKDGVRLYLAEEDITDAGQLSRWTADRVSTEVKCDGTPKEEEQSMVYAKGQLVYTGVHYQDYENDPSKASYWKYTHLPYNDGPHPQATVVIDEEGTVTGGTGTILSKPIERFYVDGRYLVEHWQTDKTGNPAYDKNSNVASMIIYIGGNGRAPWIDSIAVQPAGASEGDTVTVKVTVDDVEKDPLQLNIEVYREGTLVKKQSFSNITANGGRYPVLTMDPIKSIEAGKYEIVCTVRDQSGTGIGNRQFTIKPAGRIEGQAAHTEAWDSNRRAYNQNLFGSKAASYNGPMTIKEYLSYKEPRPRGRNVFWAGEQFLLTAEVAGKPTSVTAQIGGYQTRMTSTGVVNSDGEAIYKGTLWDKAMRSQWGKKPEEKEVIFKAYYAGAEPKEHRVTVILDSNTEYWLLHRYQ